MYPKPIQYNFDRVFRWFSLLFGESQIQTQVQPSSLRRGTEDTLVVVSANLWHDWPRHRNLPARLEAFARTVEREGADLVLLQEVARLPDLQCDSWLADRLGMSSVYVRVNGHVDAIGFEEGLTILSRNPISNFQSIKLEPARLPMINRMALGAQVSMESGSFWTFTTHLAIFNHPNMSQLAHLRSWVTAITGNSMAIIGGDFNAGESTEQIRSARTHWIDLYRRRNPTELGNTLYIKTPMGLIGRRLDYLFLHQGEPNWQVQDAHHVYGEEPYSDHASVLARLRYRAPLSMN